MQLMPQHCAGPAVALVSFGITQAVPAGCTTDTGSVT